MTDQVPAWYKDQWAAQTILKFQNRGYNLKGMTTPPVRIEGKEFHWLRSGVVDAVPYARGDTVQGLNPNDDEVKMASSEWDAPFYIYDFDKTRLSVNETDTRQMQAARAIGRRADLIIWDKIMAEALPAGEQTIGHQAVAANTAAITPYLLMQGTKVLADADVEFENDVFCPIPAGPWEQLKTYRIFSSSLYVGPELPFVKRSEARTWNGVHWFRAPKYMYQYTDATNNAYKTRMWSAKAVGAGHNEDLRNEWERQATKKRWFVNHTIDGAAAVLLPEGMVQFEFLAAATIAPEIIQTHAN